MSHTPLLALERVGKRFGPLQALDDVSIELYAGRALALVGESGSGKTTCARVLMLQHQPSAGRVLFRGRDVATLDGKGELLAYRRAVQMVFQDPFGSLNPVHTIFHHIARPLSLHAGMADRKALRARVMELLAAVELDPEATAPKYPHQLSGGQRQRVNIARTLAVGAEVVLADEPTSMLDVSIRLGVLNLLEKMKRERGMAFLYITHDIATARYVAEEIAVMYAGRIVEWGDTGAVIDSPQHPYTQLLLSAVPDPERPFDGEASQLQAELVAQARDAARTPGGVRQIAGNHFVRAA
ncbi:ABC transporter ATP-binding protein [Inquilinus limosus]|uniref:Dipeptide/oligopeptide/nickel ABC transporter ATP-binding protein n=1 Tax=Inquilinus limosus TaxID=171674 RepID=A0A211Z9Z8_9PROT|nr:ATP-binding cassette domain-containing protein [Inquilinus limosus]OWJ62099.1 dipeptide/oligopeptide/nickel ABC transporter ATP-binding protein [Inquilinus limosus]